MNLFAQIKIEQIVTNMRDSVKLGQEKLEVNNSQNEIFWKEYFSVTQKMWRIKDISEFDVRVPLHTMFQKNGKIRVARSENDKAKC